MVGTPVNILILQWRKQKFGQDEWQSLGKKAYLLSGRDKFWIPEDGSRFGLLTSLPPWLQKGKQPRLSREKGWRPEEAGSDVNRWRMGGKHILRKEKYGYGNRLREPGNSDLTLKLDKGGEELRWQRNRMGRPLSPLQIHQKNIWKLSKLHKTTSDR